MLLKKTKRFVTLDIRDIDPSPSQARTQFGKKELADMADSIRTNGILQPLLVRPKGSRFELVAGERRLRGARIAGLSSVPCVILEVSEEKAALFGLVENLQRQNLNCFEEAEGIRRLIEMTGMTQEEAAERLGKSQSAVANKLRLLRISEPLRQKLLAAGLGERHARVLLTLPDESMREALTEEMISKEMTVTAAEKLAEKLLLGKEDLPSERPFIRDIRLFLNTVTHAVETMKRSGVPVRSHSFETEDFLEYRIVIPKVIR